MKRYLDGDIEAFNSIYLRYRGKVHTYLLKRTRRPQDSDEILQSVFLKFHQSRHQFTFDFPLLQWLYVISRSSFVDFYRKDRSDQNVPWSQEEIDLRASEEETVDIGVDLKTLDSLDPSHQSIVKARIIDDESYSEIAKRLNRSEASIRQIFSRAMKKLKTQILMEEKNGISK